MKGQNSENKESEPESPSVNNADSVARDADFELDVIRKIASVTVAPKS